MAKDKNGNGIIDRDELDDCLALLGVATTSEELTFLKNQFDANGKKVVYEHLKWRGISQDTVGHFEWRHMVC